MSRDLIRVRGVATAVVRRMAVDDEEAAETPLSWAMLEERPADPRPVTIFVEPGESRVPWDGEKGFEVDLRVDFRVNEQNVA